jgi:predicted CXXCH cytochrome family protein
LILDGPTLEGPSRIADYPSMAPLGRRCVPLLVVSLLVVAGGCAGDTGSEGPSGGAGGSEAPPDLELERAIFGLVGRVIEPSQAPVPGGTVYLVPAADVAELAAMPINLFLSPEATAASTIDEPIEDLIDTRGNSYAQAPVDANGEYRFETLPEGSHFVTWVPSVADQTHLPGGDYCRTAFSTASLTGMRMDIRVSPQPSASATYVGSSTCLPCHSQFQSTTRTAHNVGLQVPGVRSVLQDIRPWPNFDDGLARFDAGTTLFYYDCETSPSTREDPSNCKVDVQPPAGGFIFAVMLGRDLSKPLGEVGAYFVELVNPNADPEQRVSYDVVLTYGGALYKQQYLTRRATNGGFSYFVLPFQYNYQGDFSNPNSDDWPWRDYRSDQWFDFDSGLLTEPGNQESFDNNCAGCHFTEYRLSGSEAKGWSASAVADSGGAFDYDGDGSTELINTGCEACHGPGSEHVDNLGRGPIISPASLTPGRETAICGSCHSRPLGIGDGMTEPTGLPLSAENRMPPPGIRRADFALTHTTRVSGAQNDFFGSGDAKAHYQQYSDHIRSVHYRNATRISTCTGCHDPHARLEDVYATDTSGNVNALCTVCHSPGAGFPPLEVHMQETVGFNHGIVMEVFFCTSCHMVPTAKSGASVRALLDTIKPPTEPFQYFWNDISNHRLNVTRRERAAEQPVAATSDCASCHGGFLPEDQ